LRSELCEQAAGSEEGNPWEADYAGRRRRAEKAGLEGTRRRPAAGGRQVVHGEGS
jgi:hypothetical protein